MHPDRNFILDKLNKALQDMRDLEGVFPLGRYYAARAEAALYATILTALEI